LLAVIESEQKFSLLSRRESSRVSIIRCIELLCVPPIYRQLTTVAGRGTNSNSGSPVIRPMDHTDTPNSSAPTTPADEHSAALGGSDYFHGLPRLPHNMSSKSLPTTPNGSSRNISFSPRLQFHDAHSASDYDRRGDIATCNRLTPMLAQQIKEELNSFKMVSPIAALVVHGYIL